MAQTESEESKGGSFYLMGIGFAIALAGGVFFWLMWGSFSQAKQTRTWTETPCQIIVSEVAMKSAEHISREYSWNLLYGYEVNGEHYTSKFHTPRAAKSVSSKQMIQNYIDERPVGAKSVCYVNPENPNQAILEHDTKAAGYSIWFPGIFIVGGLGIMLGAVKGMRSGRC